MAQKDLQLVGLKVEMVLGFRSKMVLHKELEDNLREYYIITGL